MKIKTLSLLVLLGFMSCAKKEYTPTDEGGFKVKAITEVRVVLYSISNIDKEYISADWKVYPNQEVVSLHFHNKLKVVCPVPNNCGYTVNGHYFNETKTFKRGTI